MTTPCLAAPPLGERFEWIRQLGQGGYGRVDLVFDRSRRTQVALKQLDVGRRQPDSLKHEFRALRDLAHPNLVTMLELLIDPPLECILLEPVEGVDFLRHLGVEAITNLSATRTAGTFVGTAPSAISPSGRAGVQGDWGRVVAAATQIVDALEHLERHGWVHGDLKNDNVLVDRDGRVVLLDFGIARLSGTTLLQPTGTLQYMAPEQLTSGSVLTPAVDRYALGVLLFETIVGEPPFSGSAGEVRAQKSIGPGVRPEGPLGPLVLALMDPDAAKRPSLAEVRESLSVLGSPGRSTRVLALDEKGMSPTPFVGRARELSLLREVCRGEGPRLAMVVAGAGVGKTALSEELARSVEATLLRSRCYANESIRWNAVDGLIDGLLQRVELWTIGAEPRFDALRLLFPALGPVSDEAALARAPAHVQVRAAVVGMATLLAHAGVETLLVDDAQWADSDSLSFLIELVRASPRLRLVVAMRGPDDRSRDLLAQLRDVEPVREILLPPLEDGDAAALLATLSVDGRDTAALREATGGVPFLIEELAWALRSGEAPESGAAAVARRLRALDPIERAILDLVAVHDAPLEEPVLVHAAKASPHVLRGLVHRRVLRPERAGRTQQKYDVYHDVVRQAWLAGQPPEHKSETHAVLAEALLSLGGYAVDDVARHLFAVGDPRRERYGLEAAVEAERVLAFERAATWYERCAALPGSAEQRGALLERLADCHRLAEHHYDAAEALERRAELCVGFARSEVRRRAAEQWLTAGEIERGARLLRDLGAERDLGLITGEQGTGAFLLARGRVAVASLMGEARPASDAAAHELATRLDMAWTIAGCLALIDPIRSGTVHSLGLAEALRSGDASRLARALAGEAFYLGMFGASRRREVEALLDRIDRLVERLDDHAQVIALSTRGGVSVERGDFQLGMELLSKAIARLEKHPETVGWEVMPVRHFYLHALYYVGRFEELQSYVEGEYQAGSARRNRHRMSDVSLNHATLAWLLGHGVETATERMQMGSRFWARIGPNVQRYYALDSEIEIHLFAGDYPAAWQALVARGLAVVTPPMVGAEGLRIDALHAAGRAALAGASSGAKGAVATAFGLTALLLRESAGYARALGLLQLACWFAATGRVSRAIPTARRAAERCSAAGLNAYAEVARAYVEGRAPALPIHPLALGRVLAPGLFPPA